MCGPTQAEKNIANQGEAYASTVQSNYNTLFGEDQSNLNTLKGLLTPMAQGGQGFTPQQLSAMNTTALDTTGANYANAARALSGQLAGRSPTSTVQSGVDQQLKAQLASNAAGTLSQEQLGITQANAQQAQQNQKFAIGGLQTLSQLYDPTAAAGAGTKAGSLAFGEANEIAQQEAQEDSAIAGGIASAAMGAATFGAGAMGGGGLAGGLQALTGVSPSSGGGGGGGSSGGGGNNFGDDDTYGSWG